MVTMGLYTMMKRLSKSGRSYCRNRHVTNSYLCYQCYWLPIRISSSSSTRPLLPFFLSFFVALHALFQICMPDDILYRIMGYVRRINYTEPPRRSDGRLCAPPGPCLQIYLSTVTNAHQLKRNVIKALLYRKLYSNNISFGTSRK